MPVPVFPSKRAPIYQNVPDEKWNDWRWQLSHRLNSLSEIEQVLELSESERVALGKKGLFRVDVTPYFISLMDPKDPNDPVRRQVIPTDQELSAFTGMMEDSLAEDAHSPVPGLVHRYPDRALMLVTTQCGSYCRYCTRGRIVGDPMATFSREEMDAQIDYLERTPQIRDVLLIRRRSAGAGAQAAGRAAHAPACHPAHRDRAHRFARAGLHAHARDGRAVRDVVQIPPAVAQYSRQSSQ